MSSSVLLFHQRPDTAPAGAWGSGAKLSDAAEKYLARRIARMNGETRPETNASLLPSPAPICVECFNRGVTQRQALARDLTFLAKQLENPLRLGLADDQHRVDLSRLHHIGSKVTGRFADQHACAVCRV